ncbi:MAG TPA: CoA transferase [Acidimicrobiales bacterium]|nr:CoA transferase [Acidimicrobiales bacterium]
MLDCSRGAAGSLATMVLADFGADVIRVEPIGVEGSLHEEAPEYLLLHRGKRSVTIDLDDGADRAELHRLLPGVDVLVEDWGPGRAADRGLDDDALANAYPALVVCSISGFGTTGPKADLPADDALVMAKAGIFRDQPGWEQDGKRPIFRSCPDASYFAGMLTVQGALAALRARDLTGRGQRIDVSMLMAITCRQNPQVRWLLREGEELPVDRASSTETVPDAINPLAHHRDPREVTLTGMLVQCADGRWIMHSLSEPHFFPAWIEAIGFQWIWDDERFAGAPWRFPDDEAKVELVQRLQARMKEKTSTEWIELYLANGNVCADVIQTTQQALRHPQLEATANLVDFDDPRVGRVRQIGPLAKLTGAPGQVRSPAPIPGEHRAQVRAEPVVPREVDPSTTRQLRGPLDGITVVEAAYYYATPFATALLAELGARVIKIEPVAGDPYRLLGRGGGDPVTALGHNNMVRAMQGKESIALNLKDPRGREIIHRLVAGADLFVHSFRGRVPEALGIDEATLRRVNPRLVYQYAASYGSTGPHAAQPAIDPVIAAFAGQTAHQTGEGNPPLRESGADPVAAAGHAAAMVLGLFARHRTGEGQQVESSMIVSNIYLNYEDALAYEGKPPRSAVDRRQLGTSATHRLYECAPATEASAKLPHGNPEPRWIMLAAGDDDAFARFCDAIGRDDLTADERFSTASARTEHRTALEAELEPVFLTRPADEWETRLPASGIGCVVADAASHFAFLYEDPHAQAIGMMTKVEHPSLGGPYWRYAPVLQLSGTPSVALPFCDLGEHSTPLLREHDYDDDAIGELVEAGVVGVGTGEPASTGR